MHDFALSKLYDVTVFRESPSFFATLVDLPTLSLYNSKEKNTLHKHITARREVPDD